MGKLANPEIYRDRIVDDKLDYYLSEHGAVSIEGPRYCGKSWTASMHSKDEKLIENPKTVSADSKRTGDIELSADQIQLLLEGERPVMLDEWHKVRNLLDAVTYRVDTCRDNGQFILTRSASPVNLVTNFSRTGRIAPIRMGTMTLYETGDSNGAVSLEALCRGELTGVSAGKTSKADIARFVMRGGWPKTFDAETIDLSTPTTYLSSIIKNDTHSADSNRNYSKNDVRRLLLSLARNECSTASISTLADDVFSDVPNEDRGDRNRHIDRVTEYLDLLDGLYLLDNTPPFPGSNLRASGHMRKNEKRHLCDVSLACTLLLNPGLNTLKKASPQMLLNDPATLGCLFESLCAHDLKIYAESFDAGLFHYRKNDNKEIDAVIRLNDGGWSAFEIKLGKKSAEDASDALPGICDEIVKDGEKPPSSMCVICGDSDEVRRCDNGVFIVPVTALKP